ncbi:MAG: hypothetical protein K0S40_3098 [Actinomycetospora sp.]|nr:hypothetical protein [Actinomycetospora sp.]
MRGRRSSRSAAVVLAGCVGLAVMAPGLALAAPVPGGTSEAECTLNGGTWVSTTETCETAATTTTTTPPAVDDVESGDAGTSASAEPTPSTTTPSDTITPVDPTTPPGGTGSPGSANPDAPAADTTGTTGTQPVAPVEPISAAALAGDVPDLQSEINRALALEEVPLADLLPLPDLPDIIPQPDAGGNFENVNDACLNAISQLQFPTGTEGLDVLSEQLQGFCSTLDPTTLTDLLDDLLELLNGLIPSLPPPSPTIPNEAPHYVPAYYWGYWHHQYDVDCPELTYDEANAILAWDRSDPFRLDRDGDGEACEANAHGDDVEDVEYIGYPVGGVATGDGSTGSGASGVEVALAAGVLSGLGVTGLALVRRFARQG